MKELKTKIQLTASTNLDEVTEKLKEIDEKIEAARALIEELAAEGILVKINVKD